MVAPTIVGPLMAFFSWPIRKVEPIVGRLAADGARANPIRTAATASALMIGLALVTAFGALGSSFLGSINDEIDRSLARDFTVQPENFNPGEGPQQSISARLSKEIAELPGVAVATPGRYLFLPDLPGGGGVAFGIDPEQYRKVDSTLFEGASEADAYAGIARGEVTVGDGLAKARDYKVGDKITLKGPSKTKKLKIAAIAKTTIFGGKTIGLSLQTMKSLYGVTTDSTLAIKARSANQRIEVGKEIERVLKKYPQLAVLSNAELKKKIQTRVNLQFSLFYAILAMAIVISLFGIINTLSMNVIERTREIGLLRALGSSRWQIRRTIGSEGLMLSIVGAVLGLVVGFVLGYVFVKGIKVGIPAVEYRAPLLTIFLVAVTAVLLGLLASVIPARRAAQLNIIKALSYE